jgi:NTE family protein
MAWGTALESLWTAILRVGAVSLLDVAMDVAAGASIELGAPLDPTPLRDKLEHGPLSSGVRRGIAFEEMHRNVGTALTSVAMVATGAASSLSVVFHDSVGSSPADDHLRGIAYAETRLRAEHVMASAAIPTAFPAVHVRGGRFTGWYYDGGTRLNTPIKPALRLGAKRLIIIGLNCPWLGASRAARREPAAVDGAESIVQAVLIDPLVNDLHTLARTNEDVRNAKKIRAKVSAGTRGVPRLTRQEIPYILIAPSTPDTIGRIAADVFEKHYSRKVKLTAQGVRNFTRRPSSVGFIGGLLDAGSHPTRAELLSYLFFAPEFAKRLMQQGRDDAEAWFRRRHDNGIWQIKRLPRPAAQRPARRPRRAARGTGRTGRVPAAP